MAHQITIMSYSPPQPQQIPSIPVKTEGGFGGALPPQLGLDMRAERACRALVTLLLKRAFRDEIANIRKDATAT